MKPLENALRKKEKKKKERRVEEERESRPIFFLQFSRIRVDLLSHESKTTDKREQYDWRAEKNLDRLCRCGTGCIRYANKKANVIKYLQLHVRMYCLKVVSQ